MDVKQSRTVEPPEREVLFSQLDEHGVDRTEAPEGYYAVYDAGWDAPWSRRRADGCAECAMLKFGSKCAVFPCEGENRKDGKPVIFKALGT